MAAMQGLNHQQLGMSPRSPGMMSPIPQSPTTVQMSAKSPNGGPPAGSPGSATASPTKSNNTKSPNGSQPTHIQPQVMLAHPGMPANMMGKAMIQRQGSQPHNMAQQSQPFFIQQLGTMIGVQTSVPPGSMSANQNNGSNAIRSQASSTQNQILSPGQIRLSNPAQLVTQPNQPTMITSPTVLNQLQAMAQFGQNIPIAPQQLIGTQSPTILTNAPMFIRAAGPMQTHHACMVQNMPNQATKGAKVAVEQGVRPTNPATVGKVTGSGAKSTGSLSSSNKSISALLASANKAGNNNKVTTTTQVVNSPQAAITKPQTPPAGTPGTKPRTTAQHILPKQVQKVRGRQMAKPSVATATVTGTKLTQAVTTKPSTMSSKTTTTASKPQSVKPSTNGSKPTTVGSKSTSSPKLSTSGTKSTPTGSKPTMSGPKPSPSGTKPTTIGTKPSTGSKPVMGGSKIRQTSPKGSTQSKPPTNITSPLSTPVTSKKTISHIKPATSSDASSDSGSKPDGASSSESLSSSDNKQHQGGDKSQSKKTLINSNKDVKLNGNDKINDEVKTNGDISVNGHSESSGDKEENMEVDNDIIPSPTASPTEDKVVSLTNVSTSGPPTAIVQGERQKAIVKPQVLTHVIEGFVIQEGPDPFPPPQKPFSEKSKSDGGPPSKIAREEPVLSARATDRSDGPTLKCEFCGRVMMAKLFKRSKRFCTTACAKRYNVGCSRRMGLFQPDQEIKRRRGRPPKLWGLSRLTVKRVKKPRGSKSPISGKIDGKTDPNQSNVDTANLEKKAVDAERDASSSSGEQETESTTSETTETSGITEQGHQEDHDESSNSPAESDPAVDVDMMDDEDRPPADAEPTRDTNRENMPQPTRWTVREVYEFIHSLPGCETYADEFRSQEIDGQALLLLKEDHLMTTMNIKLGPALKICAKINALKDD
ncbi:unnamed protein product [Owenia fusiformis]|uniref:Uncharacterized protein n=1 Tax=Owenia fusiformis TaxID=6347 RepID=A0A8J1UWL9_OWEFU|nr:unnamed protein product [Owenia fusiformis]